MIGSRRKARPWIIRKRDGTTESLITVAEFQARVAAEVITKDDVISRDGKNWKRVGDIDGLRSLFPSESAAVTPRVSKHATVIGLPAARPHINPQPIAPDGGKRTIIGLPTPLATAPLGPASAYQHPSAKARAQRTIVGVAPPSASSHRVVPNQSPLHSSGHPGLMGSRPIPARSRVAKPIEHRFMQSMLWLSRLPRPWLWLGLGTFGFIMWIVGFFLLGSLFAGCGYMPQKERSNASDPTVLELHLSEPPSEQPHRRPLGRGALPLRDVLQHFGALSQQRAHGLLLRLEPMAGAWARMQDLHEGLSAARKHKKPIHCHFEEADNVSYALAAASCDRITMSPAGMINLTGTAVEITYARELLDKVGVQAELLHVGRYKGAADSLTRKQMPPEARESLGAIVRGLQQTLVSLLAKRTSLSNAAISAVFAHGPYTAEEALKAKLIDAVEVIDEARHVAKTTMKVPRLTVLEADEPKEIAISDLFKKLTQSSSDDHRLSGPRIALVVLEGTILDATTDGIQDVRSEPVVQILRQVENDKDIKAMVLRINSPGGSALASDEIWHAVRRISNKKPVVASLGDMAASGGYYIASASTEILAQETSLVGSIGVVGGKVNIAELATKLGLHTEVIKTTEYAGWLSPLHPFSQKQQQRMQALLDATYQRFVGRVAEGRRRSTSAIELAAQGRLFTGKLAHDAGLIDAIGGLQAALYRARVLAKLEPSAPVDAWPRPKSLGDIIEDALSGGSPLGANHGALLDAITTHTDIGSKSPLILSLLSSAQPTACVLPYQLDVR